jgi:hypothetical protein
MPTITTTISAVYGPRNVKTRNGWREKWDVQTDYREPGYHGGSFETWSMWAAAVCERAIESKRPVRIVYKDAPKWVSEIVDAEYAESAVA